MAPDPLRLDAAQIVASVVAVVAATVVAVLLVRRAISGRIASGVLCGCAVLAVVAWARFGQLQVLAVRPAGATGDVGRVEVHRPLQFHEYFHYDLGAKYFAELGYLGLYDCTALGDRETADEDGAPPRLTGFVRDLADVLADKPVENAIADCQARQRPRFSAARWAAFKADLRALQRLVPDAWWQDVVDDKGLNPPPTFLLLASAVANLVPIEVAGMPTYLVTTSLDALLLALSYLTLRRSFGASAAALGAVTFGASFLASYGILGGAVLRFSWLAALVFALTAMRRQRWGLAGLLLGWAICDRVFPAAFAVGAALPLLVQSSASRSRVARAKLGRLALGVLTAVTAAGLGSLAAFGLAPWRVFASRLARDAHVHNVLLMGLDRIVTFRSWVLDQDFHGHDGLARFRHWNERLDEVWASERLPVAALQLAVLGAAAWVARRRRPSEAALLFGLVAVLTLASPASYYLCVLALVPVVAMRAALRAQGAARSRELAVLVAFQAFWLLTLLAPRLWADGIVVYVALSVALAAFLSVWVVLWARRPARSPAS